MTKKNKRFDIPDKPLRGKIVYLNIKAHGQLEIMIQDNKGRCYRENLQIEKEKQNEYYKKLKLGIEVQLSGADGYFVEGEIIYNNYKKIEIMNAPKYTP